MENKLLKNVYIKGIELYYPTGTKDVDDIIKKHKDNGNDIEVEVKSFLGKKTIKVIDNNDENSLTMAISAAKKVLESTNLKGEDIDMVVFSSCLPEFIAPPSALLIHQAIKGKSSAVCYDINLNCIGMAFSFVQLYQQMQVNPKLNRVLLVGCDSVRQFLQKDTAYMDACFADGACALILEKTTEDTMLIDYDFFVGTSESIDQIRFPSCGVSHIFDVPSREEYKLRFEQPNVEIERIGKSIDSMLKENNLDVNDISMFCFSQLAVYYIEYLKHTLSIPNEKAMYVGDKLGYTATASPFFALYYAIKEGKVKRGDYVFIWTVGSGMQHALVLFKY